MRINFNELFTVYTLIISIQTNLNVLPGPFSLPFIGSAISLGLAHPKPHLSLVKLAEKYGDVMRVKLGSYDYGKINLHVKQSY